MRERVGWPGTILAVVLAAGCGSAVPVADAPPGAAGPLAADTAPAIELMTLNIWHDQEDWPARLEVMVEDLEEADPDVICLQEVLQHEGLPNQAETLGTRLGYTVHFASVDSAGSVKRYGNAILTRAPTVARGQRTLEPRSDARVVAWARVTPGADTLDVYCTHLHHMQTPEGEELRRDQLLDALDYIDETRGDGPTIFAGDFNASVSAPELAAVRDRFIDAYGTVHGDSADEITTLNTAKGHRSERIDHVFHRPGRTLTLVPTHADVVLDEPSATGVWPTDHFGVLVRFARVREFAPERRRPRPGG